MHKNNLLENLEYKLSQNSLDNFEKLEEINIEYNKKYLDFLSTIFKDDNLWFKRLVSVNFQLKKLDNINIDDNRIFEESLSEALKLLPIDENKRIKLKDNLILLNWKKEEVRTIFKKNTDLHKNINFPIIEDLIKQGFLNSNDLIIISLKFKENDNFLDSIVDLDFSKKEEIKKYYYELNNTKVEERIDDFKNDFKEELELYNNNRKERIEIKYPQLIPFIWKNYFKFRLSNKIESKKDKLKRMFKIALLRLFRFKNPGIDINNLLRKIDSLNDLESMINLILKFFEQLKDNPNLQKDYLASEEIEETTEISVEAEENKEKILFWEEQTIKASKILELGEKKMEQWDLDNLLDEEIDLIWEVFINRNKEINSWILAESNILEDSTEEEEKKEIQKEEIDLEEEIETLNKELFLIEEKKRKIFLNWDYNNLDEINEELLTLNVKIHKISTILWTE